MGGVISRFCRIALWNFWTHTRRSTSPSSERFDNEGGEAETSSSSSPPKIREDGPSSERFDDEGGEAETSSSSSPPEIRGDGFQYDVFLSFRGPDTRRGFTSHLYKALEARGIVTFIDSKKLEKGEKVNELFRYIEKSKIFVPIFSKGYADSKWCLKEIAKIVDCERLILPVFFDVEPRDVRNQTGHFARAFRRHHKDKNIDKEEVSKWSAALTKAGEFSGYDLGNSYRTEATLIQLILKKILTEVNNSLPVAKHPVGLNTRIADVVEVLKVEAQGDATMVGIHGIGGIGKTTLAKAVYNLMLSSQFDAYSFISNVRGTAKEPTGLVSLQKQLLGEVLNDKSVTVNNIDHGRGIIQKWIKRKKVLLVLDDVDDQLQLDALAEDVNWFCSGSKVIITTRNKEVFKGKKVKLYELKVLDATQSLQLFSWHAFGKEEPTAKFAKLSKEVTTFAAGLPLALVIFGSLFFDLGTDKEWSECLEKLKKYPNKRIHESLKISYDVLDEVEKKVFLDIACFFTRESRQKIRYATLMWEDCTFFPNITIKVLVHRSLVSINNDTGEFEMHDHIRDMGRKIVQDENLCNLQMCSSRLWKDDETLDILQNKRGASNIEAINLFPWDSMNLVNMNAFKAMDQLRMLRLNFNVNLEGEYEQLPRTLRWLEWIAHDLELLPGAFNLENIVVLDFTGSSITQVWNPQTSSTIKVLGKLKVLNLSNCYNLTICPDFSIMPKLHELDFRRCGKMSELHPSIGLLNSLTYLELSNCNSLKELPREIYQLTSLEELDISRCNQLELETMEVVSNLKGLRRLDISDCERLVDIPGIQQLKCLERLVLGGCRSLQDSFCERFQEGDSKSLNQHSLGNLKVLDLSGCCNLTISPDFTGMPLIEDLLFYDCTEMRELHPSIWHLKSLTRLSFNNCNSLKQLNEEVVQFDVGECSRVTSLPSQLGDCKRPCLEKLKTLCLLGCRNLTMCPDFTYMPHLETLSFSYCEKLSKLHPSIGHLKNLTDLDLSGCGSLKEWPQEASQLTSLSSLRLSKCKITTLPKLPPSLTTVVVKDCDQLETMEDVSNLKGLGQLDVSGCVRLLDIPGIEQLHCLTDLNLEGCASLDQDSFCKRFQVGDLKSSKQHFLGNLKNLNLSGCRNFTISPDFTGIPLLKSLVLKDCTEMRELHPSIWQLKNLTSLHLSGFPSLREWPQEASQLTSLSELTLQKCKITTLPTLPPSLTSLAVGFCDQLETMEDISNLKGLHSLDVGGCGKLVDIPGIQQLECLMLLELQGCRSLDQNSFWERLQEASFQSLRNLSIPGRLINGVSIDFFLPKKFKPAGWTELCLNLDVDESCIDIIRSGIDRSNSGASKLEKSIKSKGDKNLDSQQLSKSVVQVDITTHDLAQFSFSTFFSTFTRKFSRGRYSPNIPVASFEKDSEMVTMVKEGRLKGSDDAQGRRSIKMMRVSIDGCILLQGDLSNNIFAPINESHYQNIVKVFFDLF